MCFRQNLLRVDSLALNSVHCKGTNTGSIVINVKDGKGLILEIIMGLLFN